MSSTSDIEQLPKAIPKKMPKKAIKSRHSKKEIAIERRAEEEYVKARTEEFKKERKQEKERDRQKLIRLQATARAIERLMDPDTKKTDRDNATLKLRTLDNTLVGRQLLKQALAAKGIDANTYAEMVEISRDVGKGEGYTVDKDGKKVPVAVDPQTALKARKHVTDSIERVENADRREEDKPPQVIVVVGVPFKDAADAIDKRNQGHQMASAQWSKPGDGEPE